MTVKKKTVVGLKIKDLFKEIKSRLLLTHSAAAASRVEALAVGNLAREARAERNTSRKILHLVIVLSFLDLAAIAYLGYRTTTELQEQNTQLLTALQSNGEALSAVAESMSILQERYTHLNSRIDTYIPGYTKYLYYNPDNQKIEVYNIAQARINPKVGMPDAVPVADLDVYLKSIRKKPSK